MIEETMFPNALVLGLDEAAFRTRHSRSAIYKAIRSGELQSFKSGKRRLILASELERWVKRVASTGAR